MQNHRYPIPTRLKDPLYSPFHATEARDHWEFVAGDQGDSIDPSIHHKDKNGKARF